MAETKKGRPLWSLIQIKPSPPLSPYPAAMTASAPHFPARPLPPVFHALAQRLPLFPLRPPLLWLARLIARADPAIAERLGPYAGELFAIIATDLGLTFRLRPGLGGAPELDVVRGEAREGAAAVIAGPLLALIGLALGALDGDALFFSRILSTEGDTAAVLALRNALEEAELGRLPARARASLESRLPFLPRRLTHGEKARWN